MTGKSKRGRPRNTSESDMRQLLIESTLGVLRERPEYGIQRQRIAAAAGVTPALISYYFPERWNLIYLASLAVMKDYSADLEAIALRETPTLKDLMKLIELYVQFNTKNPNVLDFYLISLAKTRRQKDFIQFSSIYEKIIEFLRRLIKGGYIREINPVMFQSSLWSLSKYSSQNYNIIPNFLDLTYTQNTSGIAQAVFDVLVRGAVP